jgi:hypothetical protein
VQTETEHILGIVNSFVLRRYRARLRLKPDELLDDVCHTLPIKLDPRFTVRLEGPARRSDVVSSLVKAVSRSPAPWVLNGFAVGPQGETRLDEALEIVNGGGGAAASIELGELVLYKPEVVLHAQDCYLLVRDDRRREAVARELALTRKG